MNINNLIIRLYDWVSKSQLSLGKKNGFWSFRLKMLCQVAWLHVGATVEKEKQFSQKSSWFKIFEALMCTWGLSHTDSSEEWATTWNQTWIKSKA